MSKYIKGLTLKVDQKTTELRNCISKGGQHDMAHFKQPLPLPMDPSFMCKGVETAKCSVFKSAVQPMRITFNGYHIDDP
eukprot:CAMPEP_0176350992 /NCGR_PEP_ID=MMETSP0126-20121128/9885_1 /TAXON_ID=141414 ORGANISM="Strombidinopsis acuminatum, Strain SPMC142" /NCGR_SAMPLE_ID=MMETSP0126 /ASSEMBLY_ACC=CAM_ASM_000229 /LENGTH=78 /DNA_ID=CAMNT_0017701269 /DNA_START=1969 /DNA_END=2205 /DNA_ORIENTATION=+